MSLKPIIKQTKLSLSYLLRLTGEEKNTSMNLNYAITKRSCLNSRIF